MIKKCPVCSSKNLKLIFKHNGIPKYNLNYQKNKNKSLNSKKVKVNFVLCKKCEFVFNSKYKNLNYKVAYDAKRSFSAAFQRYLNSIAKEIYNKTKTVNNIVEVGAGDCEFAKSYIKCFKKKIKYSAYDVSWSVNQKKIKNIEINYLNNINKIPNYYDYNKKSKPELLVLRHVLEHQSKVREFVNTIIFEKPKYFFIEIPCWEFVKKNNFHYFSNEHCSYFSKKNLEFFMSSFGYKKNFIKYTFNKEYIISLWQIQKKLKKIRLQNRANYNFKFNSWRKKINKKLSNTIMWGAGGKGVMLLNMLNFKKKNMNFIIDSNPNLNNKYVPGTDIKIFSPKEVLKIKTIRTISVINPLYYDEIKKQIRFFKKKNINIKSIFS